MMLDDLPSANLNSAMPDFKQTSHSSRARYLSHFDKWTVGRGEDLWRKRLIIDWTLESSRRLTGLVGAQAGQFASAIDHAQSSFNTKIFLDEQKGEIRRTECTCSRGGDCEHAVALLMTYLDTTSARVAPSVSSAMVTKAAMSGSGSILGAPGSSGTNSGTSFGPGVTNKSHLPPLIVRTDELIIIAPEPVELSVANMHFEVKNEKNWWFDLALNIEVNGVRVSLLPILLKALSENSVDELNRKGKFIFTLSDGTPISLPFKRIQSMLLALEEMLRHGYEVEKSKDFLGFSVLQAAQFLSAQNFSEARWTGAERILRLVEDLQKLQSIKIVDAPKNFGTTLRDYQKEGLSWLQFLAKAKLGGILADDMGLGKTVQLLAHVCLEKENRVEEPCSLERPFLVVCPTSVLPNWLAECEKFAPHLKIIAYHGSEREITFASIESADIVVTTYPILTRDLEQLSGLAFHGIALDEAQAIKNYGTKLAQAARRLKAHYRFCLSGTPVENHLGELWSQFEFLLPGLLGDQNRFKTEFRNPIEREGDGERKQTLAKRIKPFLLRRTKQEVAKELPDKTVIVKNVDLNSEQKDLYETVRLASTTQVREEIAARGFKHSQIMILDALLKLRQVCCDPRLVKLAAARKVRQSAKLDELLEMLEQLTEEGRKILVFSQFTSMLTLIAETLTAQGFSFVTITGDTKDRKTPVEQFQKGDVPIFLISLKAGGTGLNLTAADVVIHYDPWWNPAVEEQATDRAHRIGQTKKVFVYKLIAQGSIEQKMIHLQERKRTLSDSIYDSEGNASLAFTEEDLESLLTALE